MCVRVRLYVSLALISGQPSYHFGLGLTSLNKIIWIVCHCQNNLKITKQRNEKVSFLSSHSNIEGTHKINGVCQKDILNKFLLVQSK